MGKECHIYSYENGETSYIAGVVDILSDNLSLIFNYACTCDADVFYVQGGDISKLNDTVKNRLYSIYDEYGCFNYSKSKIDTLDFHLERIECDAKEYLVSAIRKYSPNEEITKHVEEFINTLSWYIGQPKGIYAPNDDTPNNLTLLGGIYLYVAWDYFFIDFGDKLVLFIIGTVD